MLNVAKMYFTTPFHLNEVHGVEEILQRVDHCITEDMNETLLREFSVSEVCDAIKDMSPLKASGEDGLGAISY